MCVNNKKNYNNIKWFLTVRVRTGDEYKDEDENDNGKRELDTLSDTLFFTLTILRY